MRLQRLIAGGVLCVAGIHLIGHVPAAEAQDQIHRPMDVPVSAVLEVEADGSVTDAWIVTIGMWHEGRLESQDPRTSGLTRLRAR